jgi:hypothetical protein
MCSQVSRHGEICLAAAFAVLCRFDDMEVPAAGCRNAELFC